MSDSESTAVALLRAELQLLQLRVTELEEQVGQLQSRELGAAGPVTVNYSFPVGAGPYPSPTSSSGSRPSDSVTAPRPVATVGEGVSEAERRAAARSVGQFFRRCLDGLPRGAPDRVQLPARCYVLCRDRFGEAFDPIRFFRSFGALRPHIKEGNEVPEAVFAGFPSQWEAQVAVAEAGLRWPDP